MTILEIPLDSEDSAFVQEVDLDGVTYRLEFRWNERESEWYFHLLSADGVVLAGSRKVVTGASLLRLAGGGDLPPGALLAVNTSGDGQSSPGRYDLGSKIALMYLDVEEVAEARSVTVTELGGIVVHAEMRMKTPAAKAFTASSWSHAGGTWEEGELLSFDFSTPGRLTYTGGAARTFLVVSTLALLHSADDDVSFGVAVNAEDPAAKEYVTEDALSSTVHRAITVSRLLVLEPGDFIEPYLSTAGAGNLTVSTGVVTVIG